MSAHGHPVSAARGRTLAERLLSRKAGRRVVAGETVVVDVDQLMVVDSIAPSVIDLVDGELDGRVAHPERISLVLDHVAPASTVAVADNHARTRAWARARGLRLFEVGRGIGHQVMVEEGLVRPGTVVVGSDSHATTYGALGAFGTGMGATDVAIAVATGRTWLRVPETIRVRLRGRRPPGVTAKDVALEVVGRLGADGATYAALEFHGTEEFGFSETLTLANMAVEVGAKAGLVFPGPEVLSRYACDEDTAALFAPDHAGDGAAARVLNIDLAELAPRIAAPGRVDDVRRLDELPEVEVQQVFIGTCTNGRHEDLRAAAQVLRGRRVHERTRLLVVPASSQALEASVADGSLSVLLAAGAVLATPGCGPCMGRHQGVLAAGEVCVATGNRNFVGRMGSAEARIYLASPEVAAASAVAGRLVGPERLEPRAELQHA